MADSTTDICEQLRAYILAEFLPGEDAANLRDDTPLISSGIVDSVSTLKLVSHVELTWGIEVGAHEASTDFDTIAGIADLIERKK